MKRIIVVEYPKSGGSWLVSMIGHALSLPRRDIYVRNGFNLFDVSRHPWYESADSLELTDCCVIKSHELPGSPLHNFEGVFVHLIRDGRDVIVSKYFYEKEFCVMNGIYKSFDIPFDDFVRKTAAEWSHFVLSWLERPVISCFYEELLAEPHQTLSRLLCLMGEKVNDTVIASSIEAHTKEKMREALGKAFTHNTFVRKGIAGDWKHHLNRSHIEAVKQAAGKALIRTGYVPDDNW